MQPMMDFADPMDLHVPAVLSTRVTVPRVMRMAPRSVLGVQLVAVSVGQPRHAEQRVGMRQAVRGAMVECHRGVTRARIDDVASVMAVRSKRRQCPDTHG
jgi:hypothetical protein